MPAADMFICLTDGCSMRITARQGAVCNVERLVLLETLVAAVGGAAIASISSVHQGRGPWVLTDCRERYTACFGKAAFELQVKDRGDAVSSWVEKYWIRIHPATSCPRCCPVMIFDMEL